MIDNMNELAMDVIRDKVTMIEKFTTKRLSVRREGDTYIMYRYAKGFTPAGQIPMRFSNHTEILAFLSGMQEMIEYR